MTQGEESVDRHPIVYACGLFRDIHLTGIEVELTHYVYHQALSVDALTPNTYYSSRPEASFDPIIYTSFLLKLASVEP